MINTVCFIKGQSVYFTNLGLILCFVKSYFYLIKSYSNILSRTAIL